MFKRNIHSRVHILRMCMGLNETTRNSDGNFVCRNSNFFKCLCFNFFYTYQSKWWICLFSMSSKVLYTFVHSPQKRQRLWNWILKKNIWISVDCLYTFFLFWGLSTIKTIKIYSIWSKVPKSVVFIKLKLYRLCLTLIWNGHDTNLRNYSISEIKM